LFQEDLDPSFRGVKSQAPHYEINDIPDFFPEEKTFAEGGKRSYIKTMWSKVIRFFKKDSPSREDLEVWKGEVLEELEAVKKVLRRQGLFLETFKKETVARMDQKWLKDAEPVLQLAEAFFYFESSLKDGPGLPSGQREAAEMVWGKLELVLSGLGLELIRHTGEPFDPRLHETVERTPEHNGDEVVTKIIQPGYLFNGQVVKPARVIIGELSDQGNQEQ
jgi:molecular chaperone GrpE (heat shock protein)